MTLRRFEALAQSYGADLEHWPPGERGQARELAASLPEAQQALADATAMDEALTAARATEDARLWPAGEQAAAVTRLRAGVAGRIAEAGRQQTAWPIRSAVALGPGGCATAISPFGVAAAFGFAAAAGLWVGWMQGAALMPQPSSLLTVLLSGPMQGLGW